MYKKTGLGTRTEQKLTEAEQNFLRSLRDDFIAQDGLARLIKNPPVPCMQSLVDRGYCRLSKARCGPLGLFTGEVMIGLTDAGKATIDAVAPLET